MTPKNKPKATRNKTLNPSSPHLAFASVISSNIILRQLVTEGLVTAIMAMVVALPTAALAARAMKDMMPVEIARFLNGWSSIDLDGRAALFGLGLATLSGLLFSLAPARRASNPDLTDALKEGGRASTEGASRQRGRSALVVSQIAAALALVLVASLAARSAWTLIEGPQGYDPENLLALNVSLPAGKYEDQETRRLLCARRWPA